jgi:hypothetical protein
MLMTRTCAERDCGKISSSTYLFSVGTRDLCRWEARMISPCGLSALRGPVAMCALLLLGAIAGKCDSATVASCRNRAGATLRTFGRLKAEKVGSHPPVSLV